MLDAINIERVHINAVTPQYLQQPCSNFCRNTSNIVAHNMLFWCIIPLCYSGDLNGIILYELMQLFLHYIGIIFAMMR